MSLSILDREEGRQRKRDVNGEGERSITWLAVICHVAPPTFTRTIDHILCIHLHPWLVTSYMCPEQNLT